MKPIREQLNNFFLLLGLITTLFVNGQNDTGAYWKNYPVYELKGKLANGNITLKYFYKTANLSSVARLSQIGIEFLAALENYFNQPLEVPGAEIIIYDHAEYNAGVREVHSTILAPDAFGNVNPGLLFHELGHFYFNEASYPKWMSEGGTGYIPIHLYLTKKIKLNPFEFENAVNTWIGYVFPNDKPIKECYGYPGESYLQFKDCGAYFKTFLLQAALDAELGRETYGKFIKTSFAQKCITDSLAINLLNNITKQNWYKKLKGWLYSGEYNWKKPETLFADEDKDGLKNIYELLIGTDTKNADTDGDFVSDRREFHLNTAPLMTKEKPAASSLPFVDGIDDPAIGFDQEWNDPENDGTGITDISRISIKTILHKGQKVLYVRGYYRTPTPQLRQHTLQFIFPDGKSWWVFNGWGFTQQPTNMIVYAPDTAERWVPIKPGQIDMFSANIFEALIFCDSLGIKDDFNLLYAAGGYRDGKDVPDSDFSSAAWYEYKPTKISVYTDRNTASVQPQYAIIQDQEHDFVAGKNETEILDINGFYTFRDEHFLYAGADFFSKKQLPRAGAVAISFYALNGQHLFTFHFYNGVFIRLSKGDAWEEVKINKSDFPVSYLHKNLFIKIPLYLIRPHQQHKMKMKLGVDAIQKGETPPSHDETDFIEQDF